VEVPDDLKKVIRERMLGILFSQSFDIVDRGIGARGTSTTAARSLSGSGKDRWTSCGTWERPR
jgi:hypothetical protein